MPNSLLQHINSPEDLRHLDKEQLSSVCQELRNFIIDQVSTNPGHLGASLGVVELTVALHYVFKTPYDRIVWDVGHQAYGHKILTGRRDQFHTNRIYGGLCGYPSRDESNYDTFGVGHSSTSISAALGMSVASHYQNKDDRQVIAVIGDGALTGGMAFEGLNNAVVNPNNLLIILNDNQMSIARNVGGLSDYLVDIATSKSYNKIRAEVFKALSKFHIVGPGNRESIVKINNSIKAILTHQSNIFEGMNIRYFGPVDGHDINHMVQVLNDLKDIKGPKVLHLRTKKGKGFQPAEQYQTEWHAPGKFNKETGQRIVVSNEKKPPKYQEVFGKTLLEIAEKNEKIMGVTPAMTGGCSMDIMMEKLPKRTFDVGIAEQHAVTFSAGLATEGQIPFCNIYSTFMQRAYDQVIHDVALQNLHVVFCLDRGGLVGADGPTHHGVYDLAYMRCIPNMVVSAPFDEIELRNLMFTASKYNGPFSIRYPRGNGRLLEWQKPLKEIEVGKGQIITEGKDVAVISIGPIGNDALDAIEELRLTGDADATLVDIRFLKPLDEELLHDIFKSHSRIITIEDGTIIGGLGSAIMEFAIENGYSLPIKRIGVPDRFVTHGTVSELFKECKMDIESIKATILNK